MSIAFGRLWLLIVVFQTYHRRYPLRTSVAMASSLWEDPLVRPTSLLPSLCCGCTSGTRICTNWHRGFKRGIVSFPHFLLRSFANLNIYKTSPTIIAREKQKKREAARSARCFPNESTALITDEVGALIYDSTAVAERENSADIRSTLEITPGAQSQSAPRILLVYGFITFIDMCVSVLQPLVWSTSIPLGGLGFDPYRIGLIMGIWGFINAIIQSTCMGPIIRRIGPRNMLATAFTSYVTILALYPVLSFFAQSAGEVDVRVWTILIMQMALLLTTYGAYSTSSLLSALFFDE